MNDIPNTERSLLDREPCELAPHVTRNTELVDHTLSRAHNNLLRRLFPGELERVVYDHELEQIKTGFDYRQRLLHMAVETKLQAVEEMCNHLLVTGKSEIRRERQEFFAGQSLKLQAAMDECTDTFNQQIDGRFQRLDNLRNDYLRHKEEDRLLKAVEQFHAMLEELAAEFVAIIHEGISR
ncbi:MAG: hypothetical protein IAF00_06300 [Phycisphaerales bacterium]|nr:hypothetical protein [Phycisphaerales bacterium]